MRQYSITRALGLPEYKIEEVISEDAASIHLRVGAYKRKAFMCSACGEEHAGKNHDRVEVMAEDCRLIGRRVYLHVMKRRRRCPKDGRMRVEAVAWLKPLARVTDRFAEDVYRLTAITTNAEAGWYLGLDDEKVYRIDRERLEELFKEKLDPPPAVVNMSVDEVSWLKYYRYVTNVIDVDLSKVIWNGRGRKAEVITAYENPTKSKEIG